MKRLNALIVFIIIISLVFSGCKSISEFSADGAELKIGINSIEGNFNPLYSEAEADKEILNQVYLSILQPTSDNSLKNFCGGISYEYVGENQVKYTITIKDNLRFSDGSYVTIEDIISFIYLISDATYEGAYSEWYMNDIVGLKEYYFDDKNYASSISEIENIISSNYTSSTIEPDDYIEYLKATSLEGKFSGNLDSASPSEESWREYFVRFQYTEELDMLGSNPSDEEVLALAAKVEAEQNPLAYNPENWYREKLYDEYIKNNYSNGISVERIEGINKVNDYTCTVLFNSRNINAVSEINLPIISSEFYSSQYIKGEAAKIKDIEGYPLGCGPYYIDEFSDNEVNLSVNEYYFESVPDFTSLKLIDISNEKKTAEELVLSGKIDVAKTLASAQTVNLFNEKSVEYFVSNLDEYTSVFFNTLTLNYQQRKALMGLCSINSSVEKNIGSYFTGLKRPLSVRFNEYPSDITEPFYKESAYTAFTMISDEPIPELTACLLNGADYIESVWLEEYKNILSSNGIKMNVITVTTIKELRAAVSAGRVDLWLESIPDGATCDNYERFNSSGKLNYYGFNNPEIDALTVQIRSAVGLSDKTALTEMLLNLIMEQAVECPIYQRQTVTVYNTETIDPDSFKADYDFGNFTYVITKLNKK
ncbi:MAG: hypothetical protein IJB45_01535 [Clostridia bacterium]|nr:hypothetical protein [Clostridia bacterium]